MINSEVFKSINNKFTDFIILTLISPTLGITTLLKEFSKNKKIAGKRIKFTLFFYLIISILTAKFIDYKKTGFFLENPTIVLLFIYFIFGSRIIESVIALFKDAISYMNDEYSVEYDNHTELNIKERILILFINYINTIISYGTIYYFISIFNKNSFTFQAGATESIFNFIYYSTVTITTVGYGDIYPIIFETRIISMVEVISGILFFIFFLSSYITQIVKKSKNKVNAEIKNNKTEDNIIIYHRFNNRTSYQPIIIAIFSKKNYKEKM